MCSDDTNLNGKLVLSEHLIQINFALSFKISLSSKLVFQLALRLWTGVVLVLPFSTMAQDENLEHHSEAIKSCLNKSNQYFEEEQVDSSIYYLNKALPIAEQEKDWKAKNLILSDLGYAFALLEQNEKSLSYFKKALAHGLEKTAQDTGFLLDQYYYVAYAYDLIGDYDQSIQALEHSLLLASPKDKKIYRAEALNGIANIYFRKNDYDNALNYQEQALLIYQNSEAANSIAVASIYDEMGILWYFKQDYDQAYVYAKKAMAIFEKSKETDTDLFINASNNYALTLIQQSDFELAEQYLSKNLKLHQAKNEFSLFEVSHFNMAFLQYKKAALDEAYLAFQKTIQLYLKKFPKGHRDLGKAYYYLGQIKQDQKDYQAALKFYQLSLQQLVPDFQAQKMLDNPNLKQYTRAPRDLMRSLAAKAKTLSLFYQKNIATNPAIVSSIFDTYDLAIAVAEQMRHSYKAEGSRYFLAEETRNLFEDAVAFCFEGYQHSTQQRYIDKAFFYMEKNQMPLLMKSRKALEGQSLGGVPKDLIQKEKQYAIDLAFYQNKLAQAKAKGDQAKIELYADYFFQQKRSSEALNKTLEKDYPQYYAFQYQSTPATIAHLQREIPAHSLFLQFFQTEAFIYLIELGQKSANFLRIPSSNEIANQVSKLVRQIKAPMRAYDRDENFEKLTQAAHFLYQALLEKSLMKQNHSITQLIIVCNDFLTQIPFEILLQEKASTSQKNYFDLAYLNNNYAISYQPSAALYLKFKKQNPKSKQKEILAFAPFATTTEARSAALRSSNKQLLHSKYELEALAELYESRTLLTDQATKSTFLNEAKDHRILHLATHGIADLNNPANAHLVFYPLDESSVESSNLYNYEIQNLNLQSELVVLSACDTGVGKLDRGEGILSLARAFFYTGVSSVVMTKWKINDQSSSQIIRHFYQNLKEGQSKDIALQKAKLQYLQYQADPITAHPFYWAGFAQIGNADSLTESSLGYTKTFFWIFLLVIGFFSFKYIRKKNIQLGH